MVKRFFNKREISLSGLFISYTLASSLSILPLQAQQIITDGYTNTKLNIQNNITDITTSTIKGNNAFNSFSRFNVDSGNIVNLIVPGSTSNLINIIKNEATNINGILNSYRNGQIGGNIFLVNPNGIFVGSQGVLNIGSLTAVTPTKQFADNFFSSPGNPDEGSVVSLLNGTAPVNAKAIIDISGKVNALNGVNINAGSLKNSGNINSNIAFKDMVNVDGIDNGAIVIQAIDKVATTGNIVSNGANINIKSDFAGLGGVINASGKTGGTITVNTGSLSLADKIISTGIESGGTVNLNVSGKTWEINDSNIDVSGKTGGTINHIAGQQITSSGKYIAQGNDGVGGNINITAPALKFLSTELDASGKTGGGTILLGGEYQGGKNLTTDVIPNAQTLIMNNSTTVKADTTGDNGTGGKIITWADKKAIVLGDFSAIPGKLSGDGGFVEVSSGDTLTFDGTIKTGLDGRNGKVLFDPKNILIATQGPSSSYTLIMGYDYAGATNININVNLDVNDAFGTSVSLNNNRLAVGAIGDSGFNNTKNSTGAVYLYSFTDDMFNGGTLEGIIGDGYVGGKNINQPLDNNDFFGKSVSLNGNRLAVGAMWDDGFNNLKVDSGAVYLYSFTDAAFNGGTLEAMIGDGYAGGKNINQPLDAGDWFGGSVSIDGNRLGVGALRDSGFNNLKANSGAIYLYSFNDAVFTGGTLQAMIGDGYVGPKDINQTLNVADCLGSAVSLVGNRLVGGAYLDDGFNNLKSDSGAVYLYSYTDAAFNGGVIEGTIGDGYVGGKNVNQTLDDSDYFGIGASLNNNSLAVGAYGDDGFANAKSDSGAAYLFTFTDAAFNGGANAGILGDNYSGGGNLNITLDNGDNFGSDVSFVNNNLVVGAYHDDGNANVRTDSGAVYAFNNVMNFNDYSYDSNPASDITISSETVNNLLGAPQDVTLQANNDLTVGAEILATGSATNGVLTLQAGRSILINQNITTKNNINIYANDLLANGVVDAQREAGDAVITMAAGTSIVAGNNTINIELRNGAGKTFTGAGDITLLTVSGGTVNITNSTGNILNPIADPLNLSRIFALNNNLTLTANNGGIGTVAIPLRTEMFNTGNVTATALNDININQNLNNMRINRVECASGNVNLIAEGSILDDRAGELTNIIGNNISLTSTAGTIGTIADDLNIDTQGGVLDATANGNINITESTGLMRVNIVESNAADVMLTNESSIIDARNGDLANVTGYNISLNSSGAAIGTFDNSLKTNLTGGNLTVSALGYIGITETADDLTINRISNNGNAEVKLVSAGSILDGTADEGANIISGNLNLLTQGNGSIGNDLDVDTNGTITTVARGGIWIEELAGDLNLSLASTAGANIVRLTANGSILDASAAETPNIIAGNINLLSYNGSIGTNANDLNVHTDFNLTGGNLNSNAMTAINLSHDHSGANLRINRVVCNAGDVKITSKAGIIDDSGAETPNILGTNIVINAVDGSSIGTYNDDLNIQLFGGNLTANGFGYINIGSSGGDLLINSVANPGTADVNIVSTGSILDSSVAETANIVARGLTINTNSGTIGTIANDLNIDTNFNSAGGKLIAFAQGLININELVGTLNIDAISNAGRSDVIVQSEGSLINSATPGINSNIYSGNMTLTSINGTIGTVLNPLQLYVNYNPAITSGVLNATASNGLISINQPQGNLILNQIISGNNITLNSGASILTNTHLPVINLTGVNLNITSPIAIGTVANPIEVHATGTVNANSPNTHVHQN